MSQKAIFLDRDGTLNREVHYLAKVEDFEWLPGARKALVDLQAAGFALVVITNQSGIAQGMLEPEDLDVIHVRMQADLTEDGVTLAGIYHCPHHPHLGRAPWVRSCECRKPKSGMLQDAIRDLDLDPSRSFAVGDSLRDLQAGLTLGIPGFLVRTGKGAKQEPQIEQELGPDWAQHAQVCDDLAQAAERILAQQS